MIIRPLQNTTVIVTRPAGQGESLLQRLQNAGANTIHLPVMKITPITAPLVELGPTPVDVIIFISSNAVRHGLSAMGGVENLHTAQQRGTKILAIGDATAQALQQQQISTENSHRPDNNGEARFDSEGLLASPTLNDVAGKTIFIVRGIGGRSLLGDTLTTRGATVEYIEVYKREAAGYSHSGSLAQRLQHADVVTVASEQSLEFLRQLVFTQSPGLFTSVWPLIKLVVPSNRVLQTALKSGIETMPIVAKNATDTETFLAVVRATRGKAAHRFYPSLVSGSD